MKNNNIKKKVIKEFFNFYTFIVLVVGVIIYKIIRPTSSIVESLVRSLQTIFIVKISFITNKSNYYITLPLLFVVVFISIKLLLVFE